MQLQYCEGTHRFMLSMLEIKTCLKLKSSASILWFYKIKSSSHTEGRKFNNKATEVMDQ